MLIIFSKGFNEKHKLLCVGFRYSFRHHYRKWVMIPYGRV